MADPVYKWVLSLGADSKKIHSVQDRLRFVCDYYGLNAPSFSKAGCKKALQSLRGAVETGRDIDAETFAALVLSAFEPAKKWDLDHIAFCRSKKFYQSQKWKNLRLIVLAKSNKCRACGASPNDGAVMHVDHILPRSIYPEYALNESNLQVLCSDCNMGKGNTIYKRF
ncbi:MAG: HNH endonuclease [Rickettsiales bacterium]